MTDTLPCASPPLLIQRLDRRERNRKHAKKSRIRKKALLETLQEQVASLRNENMSLRQVLKERLPDQASSILDKCTAEVSPTMLDPEAAFGMKHELVEHDFNMIQVLGEPPVPLSGSSAVSRAVCLSCISLLLLSFIPLRRRAVSFVVAAVLRRVGSFSSRQPDRVRQRRLPQTDRLQNGGREFLGRKGSGRDCNLPSLPFICFCRRVGSWAQLPVPPRTRDGPEGDCRDSTWAGGGEGHFGKGLPIAHNNCSFMIGLLSHICFIQLRTGVPPEL